MRNTAILVLILSAWTLGAQAQPRFEVDATWPQPLPEGWIFAQIGGVCVDSHDHIAIVDRNNITDEAYLEEVITAPEFGGSFIHPGTLQRWGLEGTIRF